MSIGEKIREMRTEKSLSQAQLAEQCEISRPMLCQIERGTKVPSMPLGKKIAEALGCNIEDLFSA